MFDNINWHLLGNFFFPKVQMCVLKLQRITVNFLRVYTSVNFSGFFFRSETLQIDVNTLLSRTNKLHAAVAQLSTSWRKQ